MITIETIAHDGIVLNHSIHAADFTSIKRQKELGKVEIEPGVWQDRDWTANMFDKSLMTKQIVRFL